VPSLKAGGIILSDRYRSSMVFGINKPGDLEKLMTMHGMIIGEDFIWPDAIFIFDVSTETSIARSRLKGRELDGHETAEVLRRVRENYRLFAGTYPNCHIIDGERSPEEIAADVQQIILPILGLKIKP
jgi:thymidylate kinase